MPFVSFYYEVLGRDVMDWMIWPANGIAIAVPLLLIGVGLSFVWQPFAWLALVALGIAFIASAYVLVFLAAAGVQVLRNRLEPLEKVTAPPLFIRLMLRVPLKGWVLCTCAPAAFSLPIFAWGVFRFQDAIMVAGTGLFIVPVLGTLTLAAFVNMARGGRPTGG